MNTGGVSLFMARLAVSGFVIVGSDWRHSGHAWRLLEGSKMVESECDAVAVGRTYLFPPLSSGGALVFRP
jgi:hypothetical protein